MAITLTASGVTVTIHADTYWSDEFAWFPVEQSAQRTITGSLIVSVAEAIAGRPITLQAIDEQSAWATLADVAQLRNWASVAGLELQLTLRGSTRAVIFRHHEGVAFEATPIVHFSDVDNDDFYRIVLRLMEI